jgi:hypothetical protein
MIEAITKERWQQAQVAERACHSLESQAGYDHYAKSYETMFRYLGMEKDQHGKAILEIGPADFPALAYCSNYKGTIIEPMVSGLLDETCARLGISIVARPFEEFHLGGIADETWVFNCVQHVIDPEVFIAKCKQSASVVRFFEPIDCGTCDYHPHTFAMDDFIRWFGKAERYIGGTDEGFHTADCAYGTWRRDA